MPHPDFGEAVVAVVVLEAGSELDEKAVAASLKESLANFKLPKRLMVINELPRNSMGKVGKAGLRKTYSDLFTV